jgi:hypothetical protein
MLVKQIEILWSNCSYVRDQETYVTDFHGWPTGTLSPGEGSWSSRMEESDPLHLGSLGHMLVVAISLRWSCSYSGVSRKPGGGACFSVWLHPRIFERVMGNHFSRTLSYGVKFIQDILKVCPLIYGNINKTRAAWTETKKMKEMAEKCGRG